MPYTVWSRGRLVGHTELDYARCIPCVRSGDFHPSEFGETIMPVVTGPREATMEWAKVIQRAVDTTADADLDRLGEPKATAAADVASANDRWDSLGLELRGPDDRVIPTESIDIRDTEYTIALGAALEEEGLLDEPSDPELAFDLEEDLMTVDDDRRPWQGPERDEVESWMPEDEEKEFPRYQIHVCLFDDWSVP